MLQYANKGEYTMTGILILAHGSRARETEKTLEQVVELVRAQMPGHILQIAYMEFGETNIAAGLSVLMEQGCSEVVVAPYFLFEGIHIREDIPREINAFCSEHPGVTVKIGKTLGADSRLADILTDRIRESL